jgi:hypothetical protein
MMKRLTLLLWLPIIWSTGFSQDLHSFFEDPRAIHFQRTNLVVRWKAPKHPWPKTMGIYHVVPTAFSPVIISNLMALGSFTQNDKRDSGTNGINFSSAGRVLDISFIKGEIAYQRSTRIYGPTNLAIGVPPRSQLFQLATNYLPKLGVRLPELAKRENGQPKINCSDDSSDYTAYLMGDNTITNIEYRGVGFRRALDGVEFSYFGGHGVVDFGEHGEIIKIALSWPSLERDNLYAADTPEKIIQWIREGKAYQKHMLETFGRGVSTLDWSTVKSLTITKATAHYRGESFFERERAHLPILPSWVFPFAEISGTVDTGHGNVDVEIVCPVIDETKPLKASK